ncbi:hypothetical protein SE938_16170 [Legionella pneumophila]|uniref:hypothetical protein n=1 Tax=Legionella pneumophila TaxID=446 RepID=UPI0007707524|nr:hypothetical protein [Legionella pneumophila]MDW9137410.1 hypothetical protein [Legionella pneumophila]MDW9144287.1 hypothetical protein [Legionella pneumophila]MDW9162266.1 hypothetical protein [Legionella pneumophila]TIG84344.1 hypothetical protein DI110_09245 [Legionella pneumophila]CZG74332.1 Uncharacterised protein [Legionella pneumophila]
MAIIELDDFNRFETALTKSCVQYGWGAKYYFPCCPFEIGIAPLEAYLKNLKVGFLFAYNADSPKLIILKVKRYNSSILVMCEREEHTWERPGFPPLLISEITFVNDSFIHYQIGTYFMKEDADDMFCKTE